MFIRLTKKPNNKVSVRIVENYRVGEKIKQRTISGIGSAPKDDNERIAMLKRVGEELIIKLKNEKAPALPGLEELVHGTQKIIKTSGEMVSVAGLKEVSRHQKGIEDVFGHAFEQLDLGEAIGTGYKKVEANALFKELVLARISLPGSKRKSVKNLGTEKGLELDLDRVYRGMDKIYANEEVIRKKISDATQAIFKQKIDVAFFDVTTLYFESFTPDGLRASGFSKDGKFKETQVMLGLITTTDGLPLGYELFCGNSY